MAMVSYEQTCHGQLPLVDAVRSSALGDFFFSTTDYNPSDLLSAMSLSEELVCCSQVMPWMLLIQCGQELMDPQLLYQPQYINPNEGQC